MNPTLQTLYDRRSIRSYKPEQISESDLKVIIDAGIVSPSARNLQPWHFTVIQDSELLDWIVAKNHFVLSGQEGMPSGHNFHRSPTGIIISGNTEHYWNVCDCSYAMHNMCLAAWSIGVGSCYIGSIKPVFDDAEFLEKLKIPKGFVPVCGLSLGYIEGDMPAPRDRNHDCVTYIK
jgi:nitroreductase